MQILNFPEPNPVPHLVYYSKTRRHLFPLKVEMSKDLMFKRLKRLDIILLFFNINSFNDLITTKK